MKLRTEFIRLPLDFDAARLAAEVEAIEESAWRPHPQNYRGNSALLLVTPGGDPAEDGMHGELKETPLLARCPYLRQVLAAFGAPIGRTRLMRIDGRENVTPHVDVSPQWFDRVRIHVPIVTTADVLFSAGDKSLHMKPGESWIFDNWSIHGVTNPADTRRIHLVADTRGSDAFRRLMDDGYCPFEQPEKPFAPMFRPYADGADPVIELEAPGTTGRASADRVQAVASFLLDELSRATGRERALAEITAAVRSFMRTWRELEDSGADAPRFRACAAELKSVIDREGRQVRLSNSLDASRAVATLLIGGLWPEQREHAAADVFTKRRFERPVFIVSSPRAGSTLLFETLAKSPDFWTIGGESHGVIERIRPLHPSSHGWDSNRLVEGDATPRVVDRLETSFFQRVRNRDGAVAPAGARALRLLEKTPKNSIRVPFLAAAFPDAQFVYLYRDVRETLSSLLDGWRSGNYVTYPDLPGWRDPKWSFLLVPEWQELIGRPLAEVIAHQWSTATDILLDDLEKLPPERWCVASYAALVENPNDEIERLCAFLDAGWDTKLDTPLPLSKSTLTPPSPDKWKKNAAELAIALPIVDRVAARARELFAHPPRRERLPRRFVREDETRIGIASPPVPRPRVPVAATAQVHSASSEFTSAYNAGFASILEQLGGSLLVSTYQSGRVISIRSDEGRVNTHFRAFQTPMGLAFDGARLAIGTREHVWEYRNQAAAASRVGPKFDACFVPRRGSVTGDIRIHEMAYAGNELWVVNTRFSCLCTLDGEHSFIPRWRPEFVTHLAAEDRCHLNGLAIVNGQPRYVTALGTTNTAGGWREGKADGGVIIDIASGRTVTSGLSMPHSPRWYGGALWVLESGTGSLLRVDETTGAKTTVAELPGFTRGLAFAGPYAFVGLSQVRETIFDGIPIARRPERFCGVWIVDLRNGAVAGFLRFDGIVQEIFDVQILPGVRFPEILEHGSEMIASTFALPPEALREVAT